MVVHKVMCECCFNCKRMPRCCRTTIVDLTSEQVRNRYLTTLALMIVFAVICMVVGIPILSVNVNFGSEVERVASVQVILPPPRSAAFGSPFGVEPLVRVQDASGIPIVNRLVRVHLSGWAMIAGSEGALDVFDGRSDKRGLFDRHVVDEGSLEYERDAHVREGVLQGTLLVRTDESGFARFTDLSLTQGPPATYHLYFEAVARNGLVPPESPVRTAGDLEIVAKTIVRSLAVITPRPAAVMIGQQFTVRVSVELSDIAANKTGFVIHARAPRFLIFSSPPYVDRFASLEGASAITDQSGEATFALSVVGSNAREIVISFYCQGVHVVWGLEGSDASDTGAVRGSGAGGIISGGAAPNGKSSRLRAMPLPVEGDEKRLPLTSVPVGIALTSSVATVSITQFDPLPTSVVAGEPFNTLPRVHVENTLAVGLVNVHCYAMLTVEAGVRLHGHVSTNDDVARKTLLNAHAVTDAAGDATFPELTFSTRGFSGLYEIAFVCDGVTSSSVREVSVTSSVGNVQVLPINPFQTLTFVGDTNVLEPQPIVRVTDANRTEGIAGKVVRAVLRDAIKIDLITGNPTFAALHHTGDVVTDALGYANFRDLRMPGAQPFTNYRIAFLVDGELQTNSSDMNMFFTRFPDFYAGSTRTCGSMLSNSSANVATSLPVLSPSGTEDRAPEIVLSGVVGSPLPDIELRLFTIYGQLMRGNLSDIRVGVEVAKQNAFVTTAVIRGSSTTVSLSRPPAEYQSSAVPLPFVPTVDEGTGVITISNLTFREGLNSTFLIQFFAEQENFESNRFERTCDSSTVVFAVQLANAVESVAWVSPTAAGMAVPILAGTTLASQVPPVVARVRALDASGSGVSGARVTVYVHNAPDALDALPFGSRIISSNGGTGDIVEPDARASSFVKGVFAAVRVQDVTDALGEVTLDSLEFLAGLSGQFVLFVAVDGVFASTPSPIFVVKNDDVASATIQQLPILGTNQFNDSIAVGYVLSPQPIIRLLDGMGVPVVGQYVAVTVDPVSNSEGRAVRLGKDRAGTAELDIAVPNIGVDDLTHPDTYSSSFSDQILSAPTNAAGDAMFGGLYFGSGASGCYALVFTHMSGNGTASAVPGVSVTSAPICMHSTIGAVRVTTQPASVSMALDVPLRSGLEVSVGGVPVTDFSFNPVAPTAPAGLSGLVVEAVLVRAPFPLSRAPTFGGTREVTDPFGKARFDRLTIIHGAFGLYTFVFICQGVRSSNAVTVRLTRSPVAIQILRDPPVTGYVVQELHTQVPRVSVIVDGGAPAVGVQVRAHVVQSCLFCAFAENGALAPGTRDAYTDSAGIATFSGLYFESGAVGTYELKFATINAITQSVNSRPFSIHNWIARVEIVEQWVDGTKVRLGDSFPVLPSVQVYYYDTITGNRTTQAPAGQNPRKRVSVDMGGSDAVIEYGETYTDDYGFAQFEFFRFAAGSNVGYKARFIVDGIASDPSAGVELHNPDIADFSQVNFLTVLPAIGAITYPILTSLTIDETRSPRVQWWYRVVSSFGIVMLTMVYIFGVRWFHEWYNQTTMAVATVASVGALLAALVLLFFRDFCCNRNKGYHRLHKSGGDPGPERRLNTFPGSRIQHYRRYVKKQFNLITPSNVGKKEEELEAHNALLEQQKKPKKVGCVRKALSSATMGMIGDGTKATSVHANEPVRMFFYPTRLLVAFLASMFMTMFTLFLLLQLMHYLDGEIKGLQDDAREVETFVDDAFTFYLDDPELIPYESYSPGNVSLFNASDANAPTYYYYEDDATTSGQFRGSDGTVYQNESEALKAFQGRGSEGEGEAFNDPLNIYGGTTGFITSIFSWGPDRLQEMRDALQTSSRLAAALVSLCIAYAWVSIMFGYQNIILRLRRGYYTFDKEKFNTLSAPNYVGLQVAHCMLGASAIFFFVTLIIYLFADPSAREQMWFFILYVVAGMVGLSFIMKLFSRAAAKAYFVTDNRVTHRRCFACYDFLWIFLNIVPGFLIAAVRMALSISFMFFQYIRLDRSVVGPEAEHLDTGYSAFVGMALMDHQCNHPMLVVFCNDIYDEVLRRRVAAANDASGKRSKKKEKMSLLESSGPSLKEIAQRKRALARFRWHLMLLLWRDRQMTLYRKSWKNNFGGTRPRDTNNTPGTGGYSPKRESAASVSSATVGSGEKGVAEEIKLDVM